MMVIERLAILLPFKFNKMKKDLLFNNPFANYETLKFTQKELVRRLKRKFPALAIEALEDAVSIALYATEAKWAQGRLTISFYAYSWLVAIRKATDEVRRLRRLTTEFDEPHFFEMTALEILSDDEVFVVEKIKQFIPKLRTENRLLFEADVNPSFEDMTDEKKAAVLNFQTPTPENVRQKRYKTKRKIVKFLGQYPEFQRLKVVYRFSQRA